MAKDSPWFKFIPSEWNDGQISLCSYGAKGVFADLVALYWSREGDLDREFAFAKIKGDGHLWAELLDREIYTLEDDKKIVIKFLDEQLLGRSETSQKAREAVNARWQKGSNNRQGNFSKPPNHPKNTVVSGPYYDQNTTAKSPYYDPDTNKKEKRNRKDIPEPLVKGGEGMANSNGNNPPIASPSPLWAVGTRDGSIALAVWKKYGEFLRDKIPGMSRARMENAYLNFWPAEVGAEIKAEVKKVLKSMAEDEVRRGLSEIAEYLIEVGTDGPDKAHLALQCLSDPLIEFVSVIAAAS